ncbi:MAG: PTS IIA-like nitrogen regulatory protein PtsN [Oleibacter sp.]|nr:PTS IIA-like nitrogen regulatory protein PtsN [Thalassolituus sp.]
MTLSIADILEPERALIRVSVSSKKKLLELLAAMAADILKDVSADDIYDRLLSRERLGSTGIGEGIAIPHCRLMNCPAAMGILFHLETSIDFDSIDGQPVDLVFALLVPEEANDEHLQVLATLARQFSSEDYRKALRCAPDERRFYARAIADEYPPQTSE